MTSSLPSLLEHPTATLPHPRATGISDGMELALFRARSALLDGWEFTPEHIQAFLERDPQQPGDTNARGALNGHDEDEVGETPLYFGE